MMNYKKLNTCDYGVYIDNYPTTHLSMQDANFIKKLIYKEKIVVLKNQSMTPREFVIFGKQLGTIEKYYEQMYHHQEEDLIFVSSNIQENGTIQGVPSTGKFWHSDYAFMPRPFAFTITYPQIVPKKNRGTYFIDMADVYQGLDDNIKNILKSTRCEHSARKYFKIRPKDIYRPIGEVVKEIENTTPPVTHPTIITHPVTKENILYISEGFTTSIKQYNKDESKLLPMLLAESGQLDDTYTHQNIQLLEVEEGDIILWDNRRFVHHAKHSGVNEPTMTYRLTVYDEYPLSENNKSTCYA